VLKEATINQVEAFFDRKEDVYYTMHKMYLDGMLKIVGKGRYKADIYSLVNSADIAQDSITITIGELSLEIHVPVHTIRYWEYESNGLIQPSRTIGNQRRYNRRAVEQFKRLKHLLKVEGYMITGAFKKMRAEEVVNQT
jgi:hypothetical protein